MIIMMIFVLYDDDDDNGNDDRWLPVTVFYDFGVMILMLMVVMMISMDNTF